MRFSPIIIGVMRWGIWGARLSTQELQLLIDYCLNLGLYTFDHADIYGGYTTEKQFGDAISTMNLNRESYQIITKCGIQYPGGEKNYSLKTYQYSKNYILNCVDESLKNLKTEYLDVLLLHRPSPLMNPEEIAAAFQILRATGKVREFGVSNFSTIQFQLVESCFPELITNQIEISINETKSFYDGTLDQMMIKKLQPMAYSVLGSYFSNPNSEQNIRIRKAIMPICDKYQATESQILISFIRKHPAKILPIIGTSKIENIEILKNSLSIDLDREDWFSLLEASTGKRVP